MTGRHTGKYLDRSAALSAARTARTSLPLFLCVIIVFLVPGRAAATEYHGQVTFGSLAVPGATVTATQGARMVFVITDQRGLFSFPDLTDGVWTMKVQMTGFSTVKQNVAITSNTPPAHWELQVLPLSQIKAEKAHPASPTSEAAGEGNPSGLQAGPPGPGGQNPSAPGATAQGSQDNLSQLALPGLLINGSVNNGAASPFAKLPAFGNNRNGGNGLYRFGIGAILDNSALDAAPYSLSGQATPKPVYNRVTGMATFGGPLSIPHLLQNGPFVYVGYEWTRNVNDITQSALVPDAAERAGDFSQLLNALGQPAQIFNPATGSPFQGSVIPASQINPQAQALLNLYPLPNFRGSPQYNYQAPIVSTTHQNALQSHFDQTIGARNELYGGFAFLGSQTASPNLFGFLDNTGALGINTGVNWQYRIGYQLFLNLGYQFSRLSTRVTPYFENRQNVSGEAGISGNNQDPMNWGPPSLNFASGIAGLSDAQASFNRNQTSAWSYSMLWDHGLHDITFGGDFCRQEFNDLTQQDPRGTLTFTGAATGGSVGGAGSDFADFLLGIPDTSSIAFGNADKYFRESVYDAYINDDYRMRPEFTINAGIRWEYGAPITEFYNRLVNLDVASGFAAVAPIVATNPIGPLTGERYPNSLIRPDMSGFEPRVGSAWRPVSGSSMVVRAGYGVYDDTSVYQTIAMQMAQQSPLSKSLGVQNSQACPLTLANPFIACPSITRDTFAIDPNFRVGYVQNWDFSIQRDLPGSLQLTASYLGTKGTRGLQEFLPNTYPAGGVNPCPGCPAGFAYFRSNGNSSREAGQIQLRRRLESGFTATLEYTYSVAMDDDSLLGGLGGVGASQGGTILPWQSLGIAASSQTAQAPATIAQNWRDLTAERSLSAFNQRNLLELLLQYTTGMGLGGATLAGGKVANLLKEWTFLTLITAGSGFPETPIYLAAVPGTGVTGSIRPDITGAPLYSSPLGFSLNRAAYVPALPGQWGNAGRYSIIGPSQFSLDASIGRTFRLHGNYNLDFRIDSTNALNHPTFTSWVSTINNAQFGLPAAVNPMRSLQTTLRLRF